MLWVGEESLLCIGISFWGVEESKGRVGTLLIRPQHTVALEKETKGRIRCSDLFLRFTTAATSRSVKTVCTEFALRQTDSLD